MKVINFIAPFILVSVVIHDSEPNYQFESVVYFTIDQNTEISDVKKSQI